MMVRRQDLDRLSWVAANGEIDVWPLILRVQADVFASVRTHDRATTRVFETLALALIPRVDDETAAYVMLALKDLPDAPDAVLAALSTRFEATVETSAKAPPRTHDTEIGGGLELQAQIDRAGRDPDLARALLASGDLPSLEAARLYLFADRSQRESIRIALAGAGLAGRRPMRLQRPSRETIARLLDAADHHDAAAFGARLADCMGLASIPEWRFERIERHDLLALAVSAIGMSEEDAIRIFLTLIPDVVRSVEIVSGLVDIFRRTPRSVSFMILEAALGLDLATRSSAQVSRNHGEELAHRAGAAARQRIDSGKLPAEGEPGRQLRPDRTG